MSRDFIDNVFDIFWPCSHFLSLENGRVSHGLRRCFYVVVRFLGIKGFLLGSICASLFSLFAWKKAQENVGSSSVFSRICSYSTGVEGQPLLPERMAWKPRKRLEHFEDMRCGKVRPFDLLSVCQVFCSCQLFAAIMMSCFNWFPILFLWSTWNLGIEYWKGASLAEWMTQMLDIRTNVRNFFPPQSQMPRLPGPPFFMCWNDMKCVVAMKCFGIGSVETVKRTGRLLMVAARFITRARDWGYYIPCPAIGKSWFRCDDCQGKGLMIFRGR